MGGRECRSWKGVPGMITSIHRKRAAPTFILGILGDYGRVESALARSIERLEEIAGRTACRIVAALEDSRWETVPLVQTLGMRFPEGRLTVHCGDYLDQPARLFSAAAERAEGEFLQFLWPGCLPNLDAVNAACSVAEARDLDWLAFAGPLADALPELCSPDLGDRFYSYYLACGRWIPLCQAVVRRTSFLEMHGLDASPLLQREFDADFWLRSVRHGQRGLIGAGSLGETCWTWEEFPLQSDFRVPRYLSQSYRVRASGLAAGDDRRKLTREFEADLPPALRRTVGRLTCEASTTAFACNAPAAYKIAVTGGPWEFAHNQLCFYNHFKELEGQGLFTYVPLLDQLIAPDRDLRDIDAVIISRGRHANLRRVLEYCRQQSIPAMYMIDDNWFWVGKDWPESYGTTFAPGLPQYEMFLSCVRECDAVLVYNDVLADDVQPHARRVIRLPVNVRQADFSAPLQHVELRSKIEGLLEWRRQTGGLIAGYIGSLRYNDAAFAALAAAAGRGRLPVKAMLFGVVSERQRRLFGGEAVELPYVGYDDYAAAVGMLAPDILVAPLDRSRTSMSKCPNKYLEYSIAGAAGVYSNTPPYSQTIIDGRTGLLVGDDEASWSAAIVRLIDDAVLRQSVAAAARHDVLERFETGVVAPAFAQALLQLIRESGRQSRHTIKECAAC
jgi:glycosyltransferase involved in cell wall biosynthesis